MFAKSGQGDRRDVERGDGTSRNARQPPHPRVFSQPRFRRVYDSCLTHFDVSLERTVVDTQHSMKTPTVPLIRLAAAWITTMLVLPYAWSRTLVIWMWVGEVVPRFVIMLVLGLVGAAL